jgi:Domain of unknown function (DUF4259)
MEFALLLARENTMGTWGTGTLDNDTAVDWMYGLGEVSDLSLIEGTLDRALAVGGEYLEAPDAEEALAAAEAVARMLGNFGVRNDYTQAMDDWVAYMNRLPPPELVAKAQRIVARIQERPSELLERWEKSDKSAAWSRSLADLAMRLGA